jgi:hypothetical protein
MSARGRLNVESQGIQCVFVDRIVKSEMRVLGLGLLILMGNNARHVHTFAFLVCFT